MQYKEWVDMCGRYDTSTAIIVNTVNFLVSFDLFQLLHANFMFRVVIH